MAVEGQRGLSKGVLQSSFVEKQTNRSKFVRSTENSGEKTRIGCSNNLPPAQQPPTTTSPEDLLRGKESPDTTTPKVYGFDAAALESAAPALCGYGASLGTKSTRPMFHVIGKTCSRRRSSETPLNGTWGKVATASEELLETHLVGTTLTSPHIVS
jgi:hypothetical protein